MFILLVIASCVALVSRRTLRLWDGALCFLSNTCYSAEKLLVLLRDGRKLMGTLCSFDQFGTIFLFPFTNTFNFFFRILQTNVPSECLTLLSLLYTANAVLEGACERVIVGDLYCDIPLGLYVIRGENVVLIGELV